MQSNDGWMDATAFGDSLNESLPTTKKTKNNKYLNALN